MPESGYASTMFDIRDRIVLVSGALGQLGRQFTRSLHEAGCRVAALDLQVTEDSKGRIFDELADSPRLLLLSADVAGMLDIPGETDQYTFTLARDTQLYFDSLTNDQFADHARPDHQR